MNTITTCKDCMYYMGSPKDIDGLCELLRHMTGIITREELCRVHPGELSCEEFEAKEVE